MTQGTWLNETKEFFFHGACAGWAGGNSGSPLQKKDGTPGMESWREVIYRESLGFAGYHFADRWGSDPDSGKPSGSMFITHWNIPVWGMWIGGEPYEKEVIPFLREALMDCYRRKEFCGGRGPAEYRKGNFIYTNVFEGNFVRFSGHEIIWRIENGVRQPMGSHQYWGGSFVFLPVE